MNQSYGCHRRSTAGVSDFPHIRNQTVVCHLNVSVHLYPVLYVPCPLTGMVWSRCVSKLKRSEMDSLPPEIIAEILVIASDTNLSHCARRFYHIAKTPSVQARTIKQPQQIHNITDRRTAELLALRCQISWLDALFLRAARQNWSRVIAIAARRINVDASTLKDAVLSAVSLGHAECVRALMLAGAKPSSFQSLLVTARFWEYDEIVQMLDCG